jgi:lipocalin
LLVENTCYLEDGTTYSRFGIASYPPTPQCKDRFILRFIDGLPTDGPSDYWVLDTDYVTYAIVGNVKRDHAWILSRQPLMSHCLYSTLVAELKKLQYDVNKLSTHNNVLTPCVDITIS